MQPETPEIDAYEEELRAALPAVGLGSPFRYLPETTSTNDEAVSMAEDGAPEGAVVVADHQTAGRGRRGRTWHAPPGSALLFSLILRPVLVPEELGLLTTALGVAGAEAAVELGVDARVKWPNDVVVGDRKLAGVIVESRLSGAEVIFAVAGMGFNVSLDRRSLPEDVRERATSLSEEHGQPPSRTEVLVLVLEKLSALLPTLEPGASQALLDRAEKLSAVLGKDVVVRRSDGSSLSGRATGLTQTGSLVLVDAGKEVEVSAGEIERLRPA